MIRSRILNRISAFRPFHTTVSRLNEKGSKAGSIFGNVTEATEDPNSVINQLSYQQESQAKKKEGEKKEGAQQGPIALTDKQLKNDVEIRKLMYPQAQTATELLLSPLKKQLYELSMSTGGYDPNKVLKLNGKQYKLKLTKKELDALEPSVYLKSYRIKSTSKKATLFLRMLRGMPLKDAITQCHFSPKIMARDVGEMLTRGIKQTQELGMNPETAHISQIWVGKDGYSQKRLDFKARGKVGIIEHKWVHVKAILKDIKSKERFLEEKRNRELARPVKHQLQSKPVHEIAPSSEYKW
ncbi:large ribosomal subunit protein uL22m [Trichomonascus vanleenenianus]|uniref:mitochondrial 54S ribosomal protein uL22m MRPL22 n=1 Tax=Trichomonascus vanleenenianus TaxID=2268995 RepID=UPI003EC9CDEE